MSHSTASHTPPPPLEGTKRLLGTLGLSLAMLMNVLDQTIANVSLPAIGGDLGASAEQSTWVITAYIVANALAVILTGWLAQRFGQVRMMVASVALFSTCSFLCGLAPNLQVLILFRFLQGFVAGPMMVLSQPLILQSYPASKFGHAISAYFVTTAVGPILGPLLGGAITDRLSWPWIFFINIPVGVLALSIVWPIYRHRESPTHKLPIDAIGLALVSISVICLQLMIEQGRELDWFESPTIITLAVIGGVSTCFFLAWELTERHPIVDLSHYGKPSFVLGTILMSLAFPIMITQMVILPIWTQRYVGYTATWAGLTMIPAGLSSLLFTHLSGRLTTRLDGRVIASCGLLSMMIGLYLRSHLTSDADFFAIALPQVFMGMAGGFIFVPLFSFALQDIRADRVASAAGMLAFTRYFAASAGTSLMVTLWERRTSQHMQRLDEGISGFNPVYGDWLNGTSGLGIPGTASTGLIQQRIVVEAGTIGANEVFWLCGGVALLLLALVWLVRPKAQDHAPEHAVLMEA